MAAEEAGSDDGVTLGFGFGAHHAVDELGFDLLGRGMVGG